MKAFCYKPTMLTMLLLSILLFTGHDAFAGNQPNWGAVPAVQGPAIKTHRAPSRTPYVPKRNASSVSQTNRRTRVITWKGLWKLALNETTRKHPIEVAASVKGQPVCQVGNAGGTAIVMGTAHPRNRDDLGIYPLLVGITLSIESRQYGEATRLLGLFQDRLLCLNTKSTQALDLAMASYLQMAGAHLPLHERDMAYRGAFNPALLIFDQVQYTGRSWTLPILYGHRETLRRAMAAYDGANMGLWFNDYRTGALLRRNFDARDHRFLDGLLGAIARPGRFGNGACSILEMAASGFNCGGIPGIGGGGGGGGAGPGARGGTLGCMTQAMLTSGLHGQLSCMRSAVDGGLGLADPTPSLQMSGGLLDQMCALSDDSGDDNSNTVPAQLRNFDDGDPTQTPPKHAEAPGFWQKVAGYLGLDILGNGAKDAPPSASTVPSTPGGGLKPGTDPGALKKFDDDPKGVDPRLKRAPTAGGSRTVDGGSGGCGDPTNAASRMTSLFNCSGIGGGTPGGSNPLGGQAGTGPRSMPAPGSSGGMGGTAGGGMSGPGSCSVQRGSTVQLGLLGKRCQQSMVAPGESCGGQTATPEMIQRVRRDIYSPNRSMTGAKDPIPPQGRTGTGVNRGFNRGLLKPALRLNQGHN